RPVHPTLHWLGATRRLRILHLRDRFVPWQMRHFYYHHETKARFGVKFGIGICLGHLLTLVLRAITNLLGFPFVSPVDILQAGAMFLPGLISIARHISLP